MLTDLLAYSTSLLAVASSILSVRRREKEVALLSLSLSTLSLLSMSNDLYSVYGILWSWSARECSLLLIWISLLTYVFVDEAYKRFFIMLSGFSSILMLQIFLKAGYLFPLSLPFLFMAIYYVMKEGSELRPAGLKGTSEIVILIGGTVFYLIILYSLFGYSILMFIGAGKEMIRPFPLGVDIALSVLLLGISGRIWRYSWRSFAVTTIISLALSLSLLFLKMPFFPGLALLLAISSIVSPERNSIIALFLSLSLLTAGFVTPGGYSSFVLKKGEAADIQGHSIRIIGSSGVLSGSIDPHIADKDVISASRDTIFLAREMLNEIYYVMNGSKGDLNELLSYVGAMRNINIPFSARGNANITLLNSSTGKILVNSSGKIELNGSLSVNLMQLYSTYYYFPYASEAFCRIEMKDKFTGNATALITSDLSVNVPGGNMTFKRIFIWDVRSENGVIELRNGTVLFTQADLSIKNGSISLPIPYMPISVVEETGMKIEDILSKLDDEVAGMLMDYNTVINSTYSASCIPSCDYFLLLPDEVPEKLTMNFDLEVDGSRRSVPIVYDMRSFLVNGSFGESSTIMHLPLGDIQISIDGRSSVLGRNLSSALLLYISSLNITDRPRLLATKSLLVTRALYSTDVQTSIGDAALALIGRSQEEIYIVKARYVPLINLLWILGVITSFSPWIELLQRRLRKSA